MDILKLNQKIGKMKKEEKTLFVNKMFCKRKRHKKRRFFNPLFYQIHTFC